MKLFATLSKIILLFVTTGCAVGVGLLRQPTDDIRRILLAEKPIGTQIADVETWLRETKKLKPEKHNGGYFTNLGETVGVKAISVLLGEYTSFPIFATSVEAFWGFNERGELVDMWVRKSTDGP